MASLCRWCDTLVDESEINMRITKRKHGDVWMDDVWIGCTSCLKK